MSQTQQPPFHVYLTHLLALRDLERQGLDESPEADRVRDLMDAPWHAMSLEERRVVAHVSALLDTSPPPHSR